MNIEIVVPSLGESVTEATIAKWYKKAGDNVQIDELILELETEKVTLEVNSSASGIIANIVKDEGQIVSMGEVIGSINPSTQGSIAPAVKDNKSETVNSNVKLSIDPATTLSPAVQKLVTENSLNPKAIPGSGKEGRITKGDVLDAISNNTLSNSKINVAQDAMDNRVERVKMSRLRKTIAQRLKDSQNNAAILTTFNEIDMTNVINLRQKYREEFEKKHKVKLGFMSFFVRASVEALKSIPAVNAEIDGDDIIYKNYYDLGVAVGTEQGLVVPVIKNCDILNFAQIEQTLVNLSKKAREGKLAMSDLSGGTFTISNGGVYGSLLSTPIINPPQSGILGLHKTQERAVVIGSKIEIRQMMYIALSYDHRIIDGKEAVTFLVKIKELIENPERLLLNLA